MRANTAFRKTGMPPSHPGQRGDPAASKHRASHSGGHKTSGAPSLAAGGPGGDSSLGDLGSEIQIIMTTIGNQEKWVLSQGRLEQQGCRIRYSFGLEGSWLITPGGLNVRLSRDLNGMPQLHGTFVHPG